MSDPKLESIVIAAMEFPEPVKLKVMMGICRTALKMHDVLWAARDFHRVECFCEWWGRSNITLDTLPAVIVWDYLHDNVPVAGQ